MSGQLYGPSLELVSWVESRHQNRQGASCRADLCLACTCLPMIEGGGGGSSVANCIFQIFGRGGDHQTVLRGPGFLEELHERWVRGGRV